MLFYSLMGFQKGKTRVSNITTPDHLPGDQAESVLPLLPLPGDQPRKDEISGGHTQKDSLPGLPPTWRAKGGSSTEQAAPAVQM